MWIGANFTPLLIYLQDNTMVHLLVEIKNISLLGAGRGKRLVDVLPMKIQANLIIKSDYKFGMRTLYSWSNSSRYQIF